MRLDDDTYLDTSPHSIGEIKLVIKRTTVAKVVPMGKRIISLAPPQKVHERSKKAIAHQVKYVAGLTMYNIKHLIPMNSYGSEIKKLKKKKYSVKTLERLVTFIFKYRPLGMVKIFPFPNLLLSVWLEMLRANDIVPRNIEPLELQEHTPNTPSVSEASSRNREYSKLKKEAESGSESDDEVSMREKALMVRF